MNNAKEVRANPFSLVEKLPESKVHYLSTAIKEDKVDCSVRTYRMEVQTSDGKCLHYGLRASSKEEARLQSVNFVSSMAFAFKDERIAWRFAGDNTWKFLGAAAEKKSFWRKVVDYFFVIEEEQYN